MEPKRKTYSLHPDRAHELVLVTADLTKELKRTVNRQGVLDILVSLLSTEPKVRKLVLSALKAQS